MLSFNYDHIEIPVGSKPFRYDLRQRPDGTYKLGRDDSSDARSMLDRVNALTREKQELEKELFKTQMHQ